MMTIGQLKFDALMWTKFWAVNESVGLPEVTVIFLEAFKYVQDQVAIHNPEYLQASVAFSGTAITLPADFRQEQCLLVNDALCTSGYAKVVPPGEWSVRQRSSRNQASVASPLARRTATTFVVDPTVTDGTLFYIRNYSESDLSNDGDDIEDFMPRLFVPMLLSKMQELIWIRHYRASDQPSENEKQRQVLMATNRLLKRANRPLEVIEGLSERPNTIGHSRP